MATPADQGRRRLLAAMAGGVGASMFAAGAAGARDIGGTPFPASPSEAAWGALRTRFSLKPGLVHLNSANLASASNAVLEAELAASRDVNSDPSFENRAKYEEAQEETRRALAGMLRVDPEEIAIVRNTSEGNRTVIAGLSLGAGDEVLLWDENHESNNVAWDVWAKRYGFGVVKVKTPPILRDPAELAAAFTSRLTPRTRLLAFSHVSNFSGVALPAAALCRAAAAQGVLTLVDGAQTFGMMDLDLHALGCDFFTGSSHKWLAGPQETGVLYVRRSRIEGLWPSIVTHNWEPWSERGARKFEVLGQRQDARIKALPKAIALQSEIGRGVVERRIRQLVAELRAGIEKAGLPVRFITPNSPEMSAGILTFLIDAPDPRKVMETFYGAYRVSAVATPVEGGTRVRFSPNIYNTLRDLEVAVAATAAVVGGA